MFKRSLFIIFGEIIMQEGAFAFIDCLGFKGIWKRENLNLLLKKLNGIKNLLKNPDDDESFKSLFPNSIKKEAEVKAGKERHLSNSRCLKTFTHLLKTGKSHTRLS